METKEQVMPIIIVTGISDAGKSTALNVIEDMRLTQHIKIYSNEV